MYVLKHYLLFQNYRDKACKIIQNRIDFAKVVVTQNKNNYQTFTINDEIHVSLSRLKREYVIAQADKASNLFTCLFYLYASLFYLDSS